MRSLPDFFLPFAGGASFSFGAGLWSHRDFFPAFFIFRFRTGRVSEGGLQFFPPDKRIFRIFWDWSSRSFPLRGTSPLFSFGLLFSAEGKGLF